MATRSPAWLRSAVGEEIARAKCSRVKWACGQRAVNPNLDSYQLHMSLGKGAAGQRRGLSSWVWQQSEGHREAQPAGCCRPDLKKQPQDPDGSAESCVFPGICQAGLQNVKKWDPCLILEVPADPRSLQNRGLVRQFRRALPNGCRVAFYYSSVDFWMSGRNEEMVFLEPSSITNRHAWGALLTEIPPSRELGRCRAPWGVLVGGLPEDLGFTLRRTLPPLSHLPWPARAVLGPSPEV